MRAGLPSAPALNVPLRVFMDQETHPLREYGHHRCLKAISIKNTHLNENYIYSRLFFDHGRITCDSRRLPKH